MRVIAGSARRLRLKTMDGMETRPTTDRIKETLFNMIQDDLHGCAFLDLFAGSGGIGIEALSRGAERAVFVEKDKRAVSCIRENLAATRLEDRAQVMGCDVLSALLRLEERKQAFDFIFMDPPYGRGLEKEALSYLAHSALADGNTRMIVETSIGTDTGYLPELGLTLVREKVYKTNRHLFITKGEAMK
jgi:16S rRNA (guanine966-N2)-methyltransferase